MRFAGFVFTLVGQTFANVWRHKLRSFLTMFGIAWGIASLVLMSALCDGFRQGQRKNMSQIGDNLVMVFNGRTERQAGGQRVGRRIYLEQRDVETIREQCPLVSVVGCELKRELSASSEFNSGAFLTLGVTPEYLQLRNLPVTAGRTITAADVQSQQRVCVLGDSVRKQLFEKRGDVLGRRITINGYSLSSRRLHEREDPEQLLRRLGQREDSRALVHLLAGRPAHPAGLSRRQGQLDHLPAGLRGPVGRARSARCGRCWGACMASIPRTRAPFRCGT